MKKRCRCWEYAPGRSNATSEENGQNGLLNIDFTRPSRFKLGFGTINNKGVSWEQLTPFLSRERAEKVGGVRPPSWMKRSMTFR